ncbi:MAG: VWA domain-containing protein [Candidatus Thermoplasmatota archaeon]|nr:VWA domain-containing protein [Candidatus Thermoplasmatota archaeon]
MNRSMRTICIALVCSLAAAALLSNDGHASEEGLIRSSILIDVSIDEHYAVTNVFATFNNPSDSDRDTVFSVRIPRDSLLSNLSIEQEGVVHFARVATKEDASKEYENATESNRTASKVEGGGSPDTFSVSLNVKAGSEVVVGLRFERMITRVLGNYSYSFDLFGIGGYTGFEICRGNIYVRSSSNITELDTSRSLPNMTEEWNGTNEAHLAFATSQLSEGDRLYLSFREESRPGTGILRTYQDDTGGYFMHLFTPELEGLGSHLPKDIIFVLDRSGSMSGQKIEQMKDAFGEIVGQMLEGDDFNIVVFDDRITVWKDGLIPASTQNMDSAEGYIKGIEAGGSTNINGALLKALDMFGDDTGSIPMVIFLTDGLPTSGVTNKNSIRNNVKASNDQEASIYTIGFGSDVDFEFLKALALENGGTSVRIPANADASALLQGFYDTVSTPLLMDIVFTYRPGTYQVLPDSIPGLYEGSEAVILGRFEPGIEHIDASVTARDATGDVSYSEQYVVDPDSAMDMIPRIWAYRAIADLMDRITVEGEKEELVSQVVSLALNHSFVTKYTSFILVIDEGSEDKDPIDVDDPKGGEGPDGNGYYPSSPIEANDLSAFPLFILFLIGVVSILFVIGIFAYSRHNRNVLDQENRKRIYDHIVNNPGDHFRSIQRAVELEVGTLSHHINVLEKEQLIVSEQDGNNRLFYQAGTRDRDERVRLSRIQENILRSIRERPGRTQSEIAKDVGVSRNVVFYHVQFLRDSGMVNEEDLGLRPRYYPN